ncbi:MAG: flavodoxin family protein [Actinomycetes bacterium]
MTAMTDAMVVYESVLGRTRSLAEAVADVLRTTASSEVECLPLRSASMAALEHTGLLVVGVPTRVPHPEPDVIDLRSPWPVSDTVCAWLDAVPPGFGRAVAVFDTRPDLRSVGAADVVAARLRDEGYELVAPPKAFVVDGAVGPLPPEEWLRARTWAASRLPMSRYFTLPS